MADIPALADPRLFPDARSAPSADAQLYALAADSLVADSRQRADAVDLEIRELLAIRLGSEGAALAALFAGAPSVDVTRHLWRELDAVWRDATACKGEDLALTIFALPIVIVSGVQVSAAEVANPGIVGEPEALAAILREHGALGGNEAFALSAALVGVDAIDLARLPEILAWQRLAEPNAGDLSPRVLVPSAFGHSAGGEAVHLRFLIGSVVAQPDVDLFAAPDVGKWGVPFTKELSRQLAAADSSVLALARAPQRPLPAVRSGRVAQREVSAQIFASNAIRKLRASVGEPTAVISAHRAPDAPGGGELRLSLSSPFALRDAEGFLCPLYPLDRVGDVASMLVDLMTDCRVSDVRIASGVHADRDPRTGMRLLFKPDALPPIGPVPAAAVH